MQVPISFTYHLDSEVPVEVAIPTELLTPVEAMLKQAERAAIIKKKNRTPEVRSGVRNTGPNVKRRRR
jgi:hypothetical protein